MGLFQVMNMTQVEQIKMSPSPIEWQPLYSVCKCQLPPEGSFVRAYNINEVSTASQGGYLIDSSTYVQRGGVVFNRRLRRKKVIRPYQLLQFIVPIVQ